MNETRMHVVQLQRNMYSGDIVCTSTYALGLNKPVTWEKTTQRPIKLEKGAILNGFQSLRL
jgi:hypothetical protein